MWYMLGGAAVSAALLIWLFVKWRAFGAAEKKRKADRGAKGTRYSRSQPVLDENGRINPRSKRREFSRR